MVSHNTLYYTCRWPRSSFSSYLPILVVVTSYDRLHKYHDSDFLGEALDVIALLLKKTQIRSRPRGCRKPHLTGPE